MSLTTYRWANITGDVAGDLPDGLSGQGFVACGNQLYLFGGIAKSGKQLRLPSVPVCITEFGLDCRLSKFTASTRRFHDDLDGPISESEGRHSTRPSKYGSCRVRWIPLLVWRKERHRCDPVIHRKPGPIVGS